MKDFEEVRKIKTDELKITDLPTGRINWSKFCTFALAFDPVVENLAADEMIQMSETSPRVEHGIKVLRAFLYNWQRIQNNKTYSFFRFFVGGSSSN